MVYLVKIIYHNHEKLLNLGEGVLCFGVQSCYHPIDYICYKKLETSANQLNEIKCPFCKFATNTFLPINPHNKQYTS